MQWLVIALGGALGAMGRYWVVTAVTAAAGRWIPWGTLAANVAGSLVIGLSYVIFVERAALSPEWRSLVMVGLLGAFTTFSSFALEAVHLLQEGAWLRAMVYLLGSVILCILAAGLGLWAGRQW
ncbi:fluoride efflux transporter CrcB [Marinobacteraceae bacterium S3BR75-40.1]